MKHIEIIDDQLLDNVSEQAKASPRLRMNYNFHQSLDEKCHRMLNAVEPGTEIPIHRHFDSNETVFCVRGHFQELLYDKDGNLELVLDMLPGGNIVNVPAGQWHNLKSLESGTILAEAKHGKYEPLRTENILEKR